MVRECGDGLADGGKPFRLHHRGVVGGVLDGQCRLMADGDEELEMLVGELPLPPLDRVAQRDGRVHVDHTDRAVAALHRHADRFPHAGSHHAVAAAEAIVVLGIARDHTLAAVEHVVEDRAADGHRRCFAHTPVSPGLRAELL